MLDIVAALFIGIHFGVPLFYYSYAKTKWVPRPWNIRIDRAYKPRLSVVLPTYNEAEFIGDRLDNLARQDYPKDKLELLVVDSGSTDGTRTIADDWLSRNSVLNAKAIHESERRGKLHALKLALQNVDSRSQVIVFTDADAIWENTSLSSVVSYLADPTVGAVTGNIEYTGNRETLSEHTYRAFFNVIRVAESKLHSTPIHNGPLQAIRAELLQRIELPDFPGSDDSVFGSLIAFAGYRSIQADDVRVTEPIRSQARRKIVRAEVLIANFMNTKRYAEKTGLYVKTSFEWIWKVEWWLHLVNPWLLSVGIVLLLLSASGGSLLALMLLVGGVCPLGMKTYRMWLLQQVWLCIGGFRRLCLKDIVWYR